MTCHTRGLFALTFLSISWSMTGVFRRLLESSFSPLQQLCAQSAVACLILAISRGREWKKNFPRLTMSAWLSMHVRVLPGGVFAIFLIFTAYSNTDVATVAWITALPFSVLWALVLRQERFVLAEAALLVLGVIGVALICDPGAIVGPVSIEETVSIEDTSPIPEIYAVLGAMLFSLGLMVTRGVVREVGVKATASWFLLLITIYSGTCSVIFDAIVHWDSALVLLVSAGCIALNSLWQLFGFTYVRSALATSISNLKIIWAPIFAAAMFGETPNQSSWFGTTLLLTSVVLMPLVKLRCAKVINKREAC